MCAGEGMEEERDEQSVREKGGGESMERGNGGGNCLMHPNG